MNITGGPARIEPAKFEQMYDYLAQTQGRPGIWADVAVVFGRKSEDLAKAAASLGSLVRATVITGDKGKDSGDLQIPEGEWLKQRVRALGSTGLIFVDPYHPKHGGDNARNSVRVIQEQGLEGGNGTDVTMALHATSAMRLGLGFKRQAANGGLDVASFSVMPSAYNFNAQSLPDQWEAAGEMTRIVAYSDNGEIDPAPDFPSDLAEYASAVTTTLVDEIRRFGTDPKLVSTADDSQYGHAFFRQ